MEKDYLLCVRDRQQGGTPCGIKEIAGLTTEQMDVAAGLHAIKQPIEITGPDAPCAVPATAPVEGQAQRLHATVLDFCLKCPQVYAYFPQLQGCCACTSP
jgi:hypothetical protein